MLAGALLPAGRPDLVLGLSSSQLSLLKPFAGPAKPLSCNHMSLRSMLGEDGSEKKGPTIICCLLALFLAQKGAIVHDIGLEWAD